MVTKVYTNRIPIHYLNEPIATLKDDLYIQKIIQSYVNRPIGWLLLAKHLISAYYKDALYANILEYNTYYSIYQAEHVDNKRKSGLSVGFPAFIQRLLRDYYVQLVDKLILSTPFVAKQWWKLYPIGTGESKANTMR